MCRDARSGADDRDSADRMLSLTDKDMTRPRRRSPGTMPMPEAMAADGLLILRLFRALMESRAFRRPNKLCNRSSVPLPRRPAKPTISPACSRMPSTWFASSSTTAPVGARMVRGFSTTSPAMACARSATPNDPRVTEAAIRPSRKIVQRSARLTISSSRWEMSMMPAWHFMRSSTANNRLISRLSNAAVGLVEHEHAAAPPQRLGDGGRAGARQNCSRSTRVRGSGAKSS